MAGRAVTGGGFGRRDSPIEGETYVRKLIANFARLRAEAAEEGMSTAEYAVGTLATVAFAGVLYKVVTSASVMTALTAVINRALK
jgi:Protein of unknown function (DUF4244)